MITFHLPITPPTSTAQGKRANFKTGHFFKSKEQAATEHTYEALLAPHAPREPITGPLRLLIVFTRPYVKSLHLRNKTEQGRDDLIPSVAKPDLDNSCKALIDCMARLRFFEDDKQIAAMKLVKFHGPPSEVGIGVELREWAEIPGAALINR